MPTGNAPVSQDIINSATPQISTGVGILDNSINTILPAPNMGDSVNPIQVWIFIGTFIWIAGMVAMVIYSIAAFMKLKRSLIGAAPLKENIYLADHIPTPFVIGLFKPKIYLPSTLTDIERGFIIAHATCHIGRLDHVTRILGFAALAVHWFNPLVWVAFIGSGKDMELSCDEAVMIKMNTDIRTEYSQSLLHFGVVVIFIVAVAAIEIGLKANPKDNPILIPQNGEVMSISVEQINEGESLGVIESTDKNQIEIILKALQNTSKTMQESVNDSPNRSAYFQIIINGSTSKRFMHPMIMVDGVLYLDTGKEVSGNVEASAILGEVISAAGASEKPTENGQCNFDSGVGARYATYNDGIAVFLDNKWYFLEKETNIAEKLNHDQAVTSALFSLGNHYLEGECLAEGHIILGYDDSDKSKTKINALTTISWYGFENNNFVNGSGGAFPAVITLNSDNTVSIEQPTDGSDYTTSIEKIFPKEYHDRIFGYEDADLNN